MRVPVAGDLHPLREPYLVVRENVFDEAAQSGGAAGFDVPRSLLDAEIARQCRPTDIIFGAPSWPSR